jgi:hypothetical protein
MSTYTEVIQLIGEIDRIISAQAQQLEGASSSTSELMDLVQSGIDGAPSKHVGDVKSGIDGTRNAFREALSALSNAQAAIRALSA